MTDKRHRLSDPVRPPKRAKTFPLASNDNQSPVDRKDGDSVSESGVKEGDDDPPQAEATEPFVEEIDWDTYSDISLTGIEFEEEDDDRFPPTLSVEELLELATKSDRINWERELGPWSAPPEPFRPPNPYTKGRILMIERHKACAPFGYRYKDYPELREYVCEKDLRTKTLVDICSENPPMQGETVPSTLRGLRIADEIRIKDTGGAQLVVCHFLDDEQPEHHYYAAKIYDPLYYGFSDTTWSDKPRDVTYQADQDYCREAAAFLEIDEKLGGDVVPKYHGSWTFQMPLHLADGRRITRDVRMILMERIKGRDMASVEKPLEAYPEDGVRLEAIAKAIEGILRVHLAGVDHGDFEQRNVMVCDGDGKDKISRVVIIDFNFAVVRRLDEDAHWRRKDKAQEKPKNPIDVWWKSPLHFMFGDWLPASWGELDKPKREWLFKRWGDSKDFAPYEEPLDWEA